MRPLETIGALAAFERRGPGTDAERRAARWLAGELIAQRQRVRIETFWCRPNWALAHAWHVALALAGSLLSPSHPTAGAILLAVALASTLSDELTGISPGRRLTPERASQNVVARPAGAAATTETQTPRTTLIVTANYDAGRTATVYRDALRHPVARLRKRAGPPAPGWLGWLSVAIVWLLAIAIIRTTVHHSSTALGAIQLPPTVALVLGLALLLEAAGAPYGTAANDNASGSAVAVALMQTLSANPPENLALELVLAGAGEGGNLGMRRYLARHSRTFKHSNAIVIGLKACGAGELHYWLSDGPMIPLRYARPLRELASEMKTNTATPYRGRGATPSLPARAHGLPAITIGCLDQHGLAPRSHRPSDVETAVDQSSLEQTFEFALVLVHAINARLPRTAPAAEAPPLGAADQSH